MTTTMPQMVRSVLPTAYVTVYPMPGIWLFATSQTMPSAAVVVLPPANVPNKMAGWNLKMYLAMYRPRMRGTVVATTPQRNRLNPSCFKPATKLGPAVMPTTAMNTFKPTEFMNQTVGSGMRPKVGWTARSQPNTIPAISAPPAVESVTGAAPILTTMAPISAPMTMAKPTNAMSATLLGRSSTPRTLAAAVVSCVRPTMVTTSPRCSLVFGSTGMTVSVGPRLIFRIYTPRACGSVLSSSSVLPSTFLLVTYTSTPSAGTAKSCGSSTSAPRAPKTETSASRRPAIATTSLA